MTHKKQILMKYLFTNILLLLNVLCAFGQSGYQELPNMSQYSIIDRRGHTGIAVDDTGRIWLSYAGFHSGFKFYPSTLGLVTFGSDSIWRKIRLDSLGGPSTSFLTSIAFKNNSLWLGSDKGLIRKTGNNWDVFSFKKTNTDTVNNFIIRGNIYYMATTNGVHVCINNNINNSWIIYNKSNSTLPTHKIFAIDVDSKGVFWLGTDVGVVRFDPNKNESKVYDRKNSEFWTDTIKSIKVLPNGEVWAGTNYRPLTGFSGISRYDYQVGLFHLNQGRFLNLLSEVGLCNSNLLPTGNFNQIFNEGNKICFPSNISGPYGTYFAWLKIDGTKIENMFFKNFNANYANIYVSEHKGSYIFSSNYSLPVTVYNPKIFKEDSTYYFALNRIDTSTDGYTKEIYARLNINNLKVPLAIKGDMFIFDKESSQNFSSSTSKCNRLSYAAAIWMGGISDNNLYLAAGTYRQSGIDYGQGPLKIGSASTNLESRLKYGQSWKAEERVINDFKQNFNKPGYIIPKSILEWPAHGDSLNGYATHLAPFIDVNKNRKYEPNLGDYPDIKGQQNHFWIFNDSIKNHSESEGRPIGIEVHSNAYAYVCDKINDSSKDRAINNTFFIKYKIINRSTRIYNDFVAGFWIDCSLGNYLNDRVGSNPKDGYGFWYNGDTIDTGLNGFGSELPACAVVMLKGFKDSLGNLTGPERMVSYRNDFSSTGNPSRPEHYYNYLQGRWKGGKKITYGGDGNIGNDSQNIWMYPSTNDLLNRPEWTEESANISKGYKSFLITTKNITLKPGEEQELEIAIVYSPSRSNQKSVILDGLNSDVLKVKQWYTTGNFPSCSNNPLGLDPISNEIKKQQIKVYPNPSFGIFNIENSDKLSINTIEVIDITGKLVYKTNANSIEQINLSSIQSGIYFMLLYNAEGERTSYKIIKE